MDEINLNQEDLKQPEKKQPPRPLVLPKQHKVWPWFVLLAVIILVLSGYIGYYDVYPKYFKKTSETADVNTKEDVSSEAEKDTTDTIAATTQVEKIVDTGITWTTPKKLADQELFVINANYEGMGGCDSIDYYSVGSTSSGSEIIFAYANCSPRTNEVYRFVKRDGNYFLLKKNSNPSPYDIEGPYYGNKYSTDTDFVLQSLLPDASITQGNSVLVYQFNSNIAYDSDFTSGDKLTDTKWGGLYLESANTFIENSDSSVKIARYYINLNDGSRAYYSVKPLFLRDDDTFDLSWSVKSGGTASFNKLPTGGCGNGIGSFPMVAKAAALTGKTAVASDDDVDAIFNIKDTSAALNTFGYSLYNSDGLINKVAIADYVADLGIVFWTDDFGSTVAYSNSKYMPAIECGKPVIYLYPTKDTTVTVKVGADVTKSEPEYGQGWSGIAKSNGKIIVNGKEYPSLFWEGTGIGAYPMITSGTIFESSNIEQSLRNQLYEMGLNTREANDFMEFWLPKMPNTKYVRISWFGTEQMEALAPLRVTPKPDTVFRIFMDYQGLDEKIDIASQILPKLTRKGFTVVEWGGLLRNSK